MTQFSPVKFWSDRWEQEQEKYVPCALSMYKYNLRAINTLFLKHKVILKNRKVLDIGCGSGRTAIPLIKYLSKGNYDGFDIVSDAIKWNKKYITTQCPNFKFIHSDVYNKHYNSSSSIQASSYTFPYPDEHFDLILLASVFTHMYPQDFEHYLSEISRVLKKK